MRKNVAGQTISATLIDADGAAVTTGTTTVYVTVDGGAQASGGTATHKGNGEWSFAPSQANTNGSHIVFTFVNSLAVVTERQVYTVAFDPGNAVNLGLSCLPAFAVGNFSGLPTRTDVAKVAIEAWEIDEGDLLTPSGTIGRLLFALAEAAPTDWISAASLSSAAIAKIMAGANDGQFAAVSGATVTLPSGFPTTGLVGRSLAVVAGPGSRQIGYVTGQAGLVLTVTHPDGTAPWPFQPPTTDSYFVLEGASVADVDLTPVTEAIAELPTAAENADAVWDEARSAHATAGSFGEAVQTEDGTAQAVGASSLTLADGSPATTNYNGLAYGIVSAATGANQVRRVIGTNATVPTAIVLTLDSPWSPLPTGTVKYRCFGPATVALAPDGLDGVPVGSLTVAELLKVIGAALAGKEIVVDDTTRGYAAAGDDSEGADAVITATIDAVTGVRSAVTLTPGD